MSQMGNFNNGGGSGVLLKKLTGDTGGPVSPDGSNNINIVGGTDIIVNGDPFTNTLTISVTGNTDINYTDVNSSPYVVLFADDYISVDSSGGPIIIELPNTTLLGRIVIVKDRTGSASTNNITITTVGGVVLIDGATTFVMNTDHEAVQIMANSTSYEIF